MPTYDTKDLRNIAIVGAAGAGKTTLVEAMLHAARAIGRPGRIEDKNTVCDGDELERELGHSIDSAIVHLDHGGAHLNIIDTPGFPDFLGKSISVLPAVETVAVVVDAVHGVETVTRRMMRIAAQRDLPRLIIVNKIDACEDSVGLLANLRESFGSECQPLNLPAGGGSTVIDCYAETGGDSDLGDVADFHTSLVDQVVEMDEALMERYLEQGEVTPDQLHEPFSRALREGHLVPVCFTAARSETGVTELLDAIARHCPSPLEGNPRPFEHGVGEDRQDFAPEADSSKTPVAHVFKVTSDPFVGRLCVFKVHQGHMGHDVQPRVNDGRKGVRIAHVFKLQGLEHTEADRIIAGDIGAVAKIDEVVLDATLHDASIAGDLHLRPIELPRPMFGFAIEVASKGTESKLGDSLQKLVDEDPTLAIERVAATGEIVLRGLGEQHLRIKLRMLKDRWGVEVTTRPPRVAYKETITTKAEGHHRHKKQTGGAGQFGEVYLRVEPVAPDDEDLDRGLVFVDDTFGGSIPRQFMPAVQKGVRQVMGGGALAGYPLQNIKVSVYDGKHHSVDSKEVAFVAAGRKAFVDAVLKAKPVLLEPFVTMEITVPAEMIGDISSDLAGRRARIQGTDMLPGNQAVVQAEAPLAEMMAYSTQLKSISGGAGSYVMEYSHDEQAPPNVQADVMAAFKPTGEE